MAQDNHHYHVWIRHGKHAMFSLVQKYNTRSAANKASSARRQWAQNEDGTETVIPNMVLKCDGICEMPVW